jgi:nitrite reductase/ring-hydroxylating ferredoxin subunit
VTTNADADEFGVVCALNEIRKGEGKHFKPQGGRWRNKVMAVFEENGEINVTNFVCPHSGGPIGDGAIKDGIVECPWHGWRFHVDTGLSADAEDGHALAVYETQVVDGNLLVGGLKKPK